MTKIFATLVRGRNYYLGNKHFEQGKPVVVTEEEKAHLEQHAVDPITIHGNNEEDTPETEYRQKFEFSEGDTPPARKPAAPRQRKRPTSE